jgi:hypothetical protein
VRRFFTRIRRPLLIGSLATGTVLGFGSGFASLHRWHGDGAHHDHGPCHGRGGGRWRGERPDAPRPPDGDAERQ